MLAIDRSEITRGISSERRARARAADELRVLLVIPTLNEVDHIQDVIERLLLQAPRGRTTLVVADGGSTDGTRERVHELSNKYGELALLHNPKRIQSAAVNLAARAYGRDADVLIRCDAHARYPADFVPRLLTTLLREDADSVVVPLDSVGETRFQRAVATLSNSPLGTGGSAHRAGRTSGFVDHGHHAAIRMDTFRRVGGYDESFTHNEDAEFDCRQRAAGARIYLDATVRVGYYPRSTPRALFRQYFRYGAGRSRTVRRHPSSVRLRQLAVPAHVLASAAALVAYPWMPAFLAWPALYLIVLFVASIRFALAERTLPALLTGPAAAVMHTAWGLGFVAGLFTRRETVWDPRSTPPLVDASPSEEGA